MLPADIIRAKRDGAALSRLQIEAFVSGLVDGSWGEGQVAALAMAIVLRGMQPDEVVALTWAMTDSGERLSWHDAGLPGPIVDKHSTGGVGDKVSLVLAPLVAACGGVVPMISGRGLGHTGGTLDKLEALPGYRIDPPREQLLAVLRSAGCAIVGASARLAPADKRLYAVRDVTATVESLPLITASILSKKLAAGLGTLVMDVKVGNGAFSATLPEARALATSLVRVAHGAGLPTEGVISDMNQVLGHSAGNALELQEALDFLDGRKPRDARLTALTLALAAHMLRQAGLAADLAQAEGRATEALLSGRAAEHFARMVAGLGGPADVFHAGRRLAAAPVLRPLPAPRNGVLAHIDTRRLGLVVVGLGGGRRQAGDVLDPRVGLSGVQGLGQPVQAGEPLLWVHAAHDADADAALAALAPALQLADVAPAIGPVVLERVTAGSGSA